MMMEAMAKQTTSQKEFYKRKKRLSWSVRDCRKPLNQAVFAPLPTDIMARTAFLHCIKDGTNIDPACDTGGMLIESRKHIDDDNA